MVIDWSTPNPESLLLNNEATAPQAEELGTRITMYRLYNKYTGEHFYTSNETEKKGLVGGGWNDEGVGWYAPKSSNTPVYRLYNPYVSGGDHHYTTNVMEYGNLCSQGWMAEGVGWYSTDEGEVDRVSLLRQYNPYAQTGTHNYTQSKSENESLVKKGWKAEGVGWYGYSKLTPSVQALDFSKLSVSITDKTYNGKPQTQTIKSSAYRLNTDYTVTYSNNKNAGTANVTIEGKRKYTGARTYQFTIAKAPLTASWKNTNLTYTSKSQAPSVSLIGVVGTDKVTATVGGAKINAGNNYVATATIDNNNYQLSGSATTKFSISKAPLTLSWGETAFTYNSKAQKPSVKIASGILGNDKVNVDIAGEQTDASDEPYIATATIDNNNYQLGDNATKSFTIGAFDISNAEVTLGDALTYNSNTQTQAVSKVTVKLNGEDFEVPSSSYSLAGNTGKDADDSYTLSIIGNGNFKGTAKKDFTIAPLNLKDADVVLGTSLTYNGKEQTQEVASVRVGEIELSSGDYDLSDNTGTNAGDYELTLAGKGNYIGSLTKVFIISKANPVCVAPTGLTGYVGDTLSNVDIASLSVAGNTSGEFAWVDASLTMNTAGDEEFMAAFTPSDTINYEIVEDIAVKLKVEYPFSVTYDVNAPTGVDATVLETTTSTGVASLKKGLGYDPDSETHVLDSNDFPASVKNNTTGSKYVFAGWSKNKSDVVAKGNTTIKTAADLVEDAAKVSSDETYYAIWMESTGYWLGTKGASERYESEAYFVMHDQNYVDSATIDSDMVALHDDSATTAYTTAKSKWDKYYNDDNVRLYAIYEGGENEGSYDEDSETHDRGESSLLNKFVEFRILEVSGASGHNLSYGGNVSDGSVVTFMATHLLPTAYKLNEVTNANVGGWNSTNLVTKMNEGEIYNKFTLDFASSVRRITKIYGTGDATSNTSSDSYKFWLLSGSELSGTVWILEGNQYAWFSKNRVRWGSCSDILANWKTRAGATPGSAFSTAAFWWLRSPEDDRSSSFRGVNSGGYLGSDLRSDATRAWGIAPAFAF